MKTNDLVKEKSRQLFNKRGIMNVTLRDVAKQLNKSYGNITYHYANKEVLLYELFDDMNEDLSALQEPPKAISLLAYFLLLPESSFDITLKYLFLTIDYVEIKRKYPAFFLKVNKLNDTRKIKWLSLLKSLLAEGFFKSDLVEEDLNYIMILSVSIRTTYFQFTDKLEFNKAHYVNTVNLLLRPYLSDKGLDVYQEVAWQ